jgi:hypothetical protein
MPKTSKLHRLALPIFPTPDSPPTPAPPAPPNPAIRHFSFQNWIIISHNRADVYIILFNIVGYFMHGLAIFRNVLSHSTINTCGFWRGPNQALQPRASTNGMGDVPLTPAIIKSIKRK